MLSERHYHPNQPVLDQQRIARERDNALCPSPLHIEAFPGFDRIRFQRLTRRGDAAEFSLSHLDAGTISVEVRVQTGAGAKHQGLGPGLQHPDARECRANAPQNRFRARLHHAREVLGLDQRSRDVRVHSIVAAVPPGRVILFFEPVRLVLRLNQQLLGRQVVREDLDAHRHRRQQLFNKRLLASSQRTKGREFQDTHNRPAGHQRPRSGLFWRRSAEAGGNTQVIRGQVGQRYNYAVASALSR